MKKALSTQELVNIFPPWSKVRTSDQSIGYQLFNALAQPIQDMDFQLEDMRRNYYVSSANLDLIDLLYKVQLPTTFEFSVDNTDPTNPIAIAPTVQGLVIDDLVSGYFNVTIADSNDIKSFWYDSIPSRVSVEDTTSGDYTLLSRASQEFPWSGYLEHHLIGANYGGRIWVETESGVQYIRLGEKNEVQRGRVVLKGTTRKGTEEEETIVFPWNEKQPSLKEWKYLTDINVYDMEDDVNVIVRSADFNSPPYWSFYNLRFSDNRTKVDELWSLSDDGTTLQRVGLITDEWQQSILGFSDKEVKEQWDLLDIHWSSITALDLAVQPFTNKAWVVTGDKTLYCYGLDDNMVSGVNYLQSKSAGPEAQIEVNNKKLIKDEDIVFTPWHARPIKEIERYRVWYMDPSGTKYGILNGSPVSFTSDFWNVGLSIKRVITDEITITATSYGEYLLVLETEYIDGTSDIDRVIVPVQYKLPLTTIDLSNWISEAIEGLDFDSDQKLWIKTTNSYYKINLHSDVMLIDYTNKVIYLKENYRDIKVTI